MFDKDNFVKALMYLMQEAYFNNQNDLVIILNNAIRQIEDPEVAEESPIQSTGHKYSEIIQNFIKLDKQTQRLVVNALDLNEIRS